DHFIPNMKNALPPVKSPPATVKAVRAKSSGKSASTRRSAALESSPSPNGRNGAASTEDHSVEILEAMLQLQSGNFSRELPSGWAGIHGKIADAFNAILNINRRRARETARICKVVGKNGRLSQR